MIHYLLARGRNYLDENDSYAETNPSTTGMYYAPGGVWNDAMPLGYLKALRLSKKLGAQICRRD